MALKASDFDQTELDVVIGVITFLKGKGRSERYRSDLFAYAERYVAISTAEQRQQRRVFHTEPPPLRRIIGQRDSARTRPYLLQPEDLE